MQREKVTIVVGDWRGLPFVVLAIGIVLIELSDPAAATWTTDAVRNLSTLASIIIAGLAGINLIGLTALARLRREKKQVNAALDNMSQGLAMYTAAGRLLLFNKRFVQMYGLAPDVLRVGSSVADVLEQRLRAGNFRGDPKARMAELVAKMQEGNILQETREVAGGRLYSITNWPAASGGWVSTHDDVTEQRHEQEQQARLAAQEHRRVTIDLAITDFRCRAEEILKRVSDNGTSLRATAETLFAASNNTSQRADGAVQCSGAAAVNAESAAAAAERLLSSIAEVSRQLTQTNSLVESTVGEAATATSQITQA